MNAFLSCCRNPFEPKLIFSGLFFIVSRLDFFDSAIEIPLSAYIHLSFSLMHIM